MNTTDNVFDVIIIGGGTAGLTAAIYARRSGKRTLILEKESIGGQIVYSPNVENFPTRKSVSGIEYAESLHEQVTSLGAETEFFDVIGIRDGKIKTVVTEFGEFKAGSIIIASGARHRHLNLPGEKRLVGAGVSYCAVCDGAFFKNKTVAVIGGGNTALSDALFLSSTSKKVYLIHRRDTFRGEKKAVDTLSAKQNVEFILDSTVSALVGEDFLEAVKIKNLKTESELILNVDGLFIAVGQEAANAPFASLINLDENGFVAANESCMTNVEGIFVAGDCRTKEVRQLTTAAADGAVAAIAACKYLG